MSDDEPFYVAQGFPSPDDRMAWLADRSAEALADGAGYLRITLHPEIADLVLLEGWETRPVPEPKAQFWAPSFAPKWPIECRFRGKRKEGSDGEAS